ncbi:MAG: hypothetical protein ACKODX_22135 [Gemmata sp.]
MMGAHQERALSYRLANKPDDFKPDGRTEVRLKKLADVEKGGGVFPSSSSRSTSSGPVRTNRSS